jgi:uncharacterized protein (TIGR02996 family)
MTDIRRAFLTDILANRDNDTPRLIYADWLDDNGEGERAEFIRLQVTSGKPIYVGGEVWMEPTDDKAADLLCLNVGGWTPCSTEEETYTEWSWRRGFIESLSCRKEMWTASGPDIVMAHPIDHVRLTGHIPAGDPPPYFSGYVGWFRWDNPADRSGVEDVSWELWDLLKYGFRQGNRFRWYDSAAEAIDDLSAAAILWAKNEVRRRAQAMLVVPKLPPWVFSTW